jgi:hypothetical protein
MHAWREEVEAPVKSSVRPASALGSIGSMSKHLADTPPHTSPLRNFSNSQAHSGVANVGGLIA